MSPDNTTLLFQSFPRLYRGKDKPATESLMSFGFTCDDGWFSLIRDLSQTIEDIARAEGRDPESEAWPEALQVKEKLGRLRMYIRNGSDSMYRAIADAGDLSGQVCEICSAPAITTAASPTLPLRTLCAVHAVAPSP